MVFIKINHTLSHKDGFTLMKKFPFWFLHIKKNRQGPSRVMPLSRPYVLRPKRGLGDTDSFANTINIGKITVNIEGKNVFRRSFVFR